MLSSRAYHPFINKSAFSALFGSPIVLVSSNSFSAVNVSGYSMAVVVCFPVRCLFVRWHRYFGENRSFSDFIFSKIFDG